MLGRRMCCVLCSAFGILILSQTSQRSAQSNVMVVCRQYKEEHCRTLQRQHAGLEYKQFGFLAAISFPFNWAASFGEFGSREWHVWGRNFQEADIPVRSCVAHFIDMIDGA